MGRKGVSKRKKAKEKAKPVSARNSASNNGRKAEIQPEQVTGKGKAGPKGNQQR